jgi:hypothetical protein
MRYESTSHVKFLRPFFALLLLAAFAELASPTFAQVRSDCAPFLEIGTERPLVFYLNHTANANLQCVPANNNISLVPGAVVPGCYGGTDRAPDGSTVNLNSLTTCTICAEGQRGCNVYLPPPSPPPPIFVDPSIALPQIHAFYDPYDRWSPYDPYNPWHPYDPWDYGWPSCLAPYDERYPYMY